MKTKKLIYVVLTSFLAGLLSLPTAHADFISTVTYVGSAKFGGSSGVGYQSGRIAPSPNGQNNSAGVLIGGDSIIISGLTGDNLDGTFDAWCVDILHWLSGSASNNIIDSGSSSETALAIVLDSIPIAQNGASRVQDLIKLADYAYPMLTTQNDSAAFQLAVWAITYGQVNSSGFYQINSTNSSGFRVDATTASQPFTTLANSWLSDIADDSKFVQNGYYTFSYLRDNAKNSGSFSTQDLVVFTSIPPAIPAGGCISGPGSACGNVPEPFSLKLIGIGLFGMRIVRKARQVS